MNKNKPASTAINDDEFVKELREIVQDCRAQGCTNELIRKKLTVSAEVLHQVVGANKLYRMVADLVMLLADAEPWPTSHVESAHAE